MYNPTLIDENRLGMASENTNFQQEFVAFLPLRFTQRRQVPGFTSTQSPSSACQSQTVRFPSISGLL